MATRKTTKRTTKKVTKETTEKIEKRSVKKTNTKSVRYKILEAAYRVVQDQGAAHLTLEKVAWETGVSKGGLLYHFRSKDDLIRGMVEEHVHQERQKIFNHLNQNPTFVETMQRFLQAELKNEGSSLIDENKVGAALLPAVLENPTLLEPVKDFIKELNTKTDELDDPVMGYILRFAFYGLHFASMMQINLLSKKQKQQVLKRMIQITENLK
ncbi:MAG: TetR/AcrR family transcriptional regulator [Leptonema sp. (in: Bacteria)]|nr:TetR/AcrR family transcriptional regulator [Leptonema sp. (in: bacteria)]